MSTIRMICGARRSSDQMVCQCGLAWDIDDSDPPLCPVSAKAQASADDKRLKNAILASLSQSLKLSPPNTESPMTTLKKGIWPEFGIREGLYKTHDGRNVHCQRRPQDHLGCPTKEVPPFAQTRFYTVFAEDGRPMLYVFAATWQNEGLNFHNWFAGQDLVWHRGLPEDSRYDQTV